MPQGVKANGTKKPRGRPAMALLSEQLRQKIDAKKILKRLQSHIDNEVKMLPTQIKAAEILLKKCMPDLSTTELNAGDGKTASVTIVSFADLKYDADGNPILKGD